MPPENYQDSSMNLVKLPDIKVIYRNLLHFYILKTKYQKQKLRKQSHLPLGTRDQIANIHWIIKKEEEFQKNTYFCFIDYAKAFDCVDPNKFWKILKEMGIPDHLTSLLRNLYAGQKQQLEPIMVRHD